jgi:DNA polymerase
MDGRKLMLKHSKPTPRWRKWNDKGRIGPEPLKWYDNEFERWAIYDYCITDTDVERLIDQALPDLIPSEQKMWELNQLSNLNGVRIDIPAVQKIISCIKSEEIRLTNDLQRITRGFIETANQRDKMLLWLRRGGLEIENLRAGTVKEILEKKGVSNHARGVLNIRAQISKASNKKYFAFVNRTCADDMRARDLILFHGANTGRGSGMGIQVHNFPRGIHKDTDSIIDDILELDTPTLKILYGDLFQLFSSCLRGMITASPGKELFRADYNAIECRVLNWIADNKFVIKDFENGVDQYKKMASRIFNKPVKDITDEERFLGKVAVLACGYGMGADKFLDTCVTNYGVKSVTEELAEKAVKAYRESNYKVTQAWFNVNRAAIMAVQKPGTKIKVNKVAFYVGYGFLWCELPSGRRLAYYQPEIRMRSHILKKKIKVMVNGKEEIRIKKETLPPKPSLFYHAVNSQTRKFELVHTYGGSLVENICQAISADIMRNGVVNSVEKGFDYLFEVHDELICEAKKDTKSVEEYIKCLTSLPNWAEGLPVKAEGWAGPRFRK